MANVIVEDVGPCKKHLKITVPKEEIQKKLDESYARLQTTALVDGFRKGHVPRKLLERRFGEEVLEEVKQAVLADASREAFDENGLEPIGEPSFDKVEFSPGSDCVFDVTVEVKPEFELPEYKGLRLERKPVTVSEEEIQEELRRICMRRARLELMPQDTPVEPDDRLVCDWEILADGEAIAGEKDDEIIVRGRHFGNLELEEDVSESLKGARFGETRELKAKFLDSYPVEKWRGKDATVRITPKEIRRPAIPEPDDEFARSLDFDSLEQLKDNVRRAIRDMKEREAAMALERQLFDQLIERTPFDLPEGVLKGQARNIMVREQFRLRQRGVPEEIIEKHLDTLRGASEKAAERNLKIYFILEKIAEREKIFVTENEVENRIALLANSYRMSAQRLRSQLQKDGTLSELRAGMREDKVVEFLLKNAVIEDGAAGERETHASERGE